MVRSTRCTRAPDQMPGQDRIRPNRGEDYPGSVNGELSGNEIAAEMVDDAGDLIGTVGDVLVRGHRTE